MKNNFQLGLEFLQADTLSQDLAQQIASFTAASGWALYYSINHDEVPRIQIKKAVSDSNFIRHADD
jgi:hypothetical protein